MALQFKLLERLLISNLNNEIIKIEHIGSTSIPKRTSKELFGKAALFFPK